MSELVKQIIDRDDVRIIAQGIILGAMVLVGLIVISAGLGLAWAVFRTTGGL